MNRLGLKISCFVVSVVIWIQVASTAEVEQSVNLPLRVVGISEGLTIAGSPVPANAKVRLTGSKLKLLAHNYFNQYIGEVRVNLADRDPGNTFTYRLEEVDIVTEMKNPSFPEARTIKDIRIDRKVTRRVPVALATEGSLPPRLGMSRAPALVPDSVTVVGPERFFPTEFKVLTEPVALGRISGNGNQTIKLVRPHEFLQMEVREAEVIFRVGTLEERTLANIPVVPLVDAGTPEVGISPPVADVMVRGVADSVRTLTEARFSVTVPVGSLTEGVYWLTGQVEHPEWVELLGMDPVEFQVIVGNPPLDSAPGPGPEGGGDSRE